MKADPGVRGAGRTTIRRLTDRISAREFLLAHLRHDGTAARLSPLTPAQWLCVLEEAISHRVAPLAYRRITDGPWADAVPPGVHGRMREIYVGNALRNELRLRETVHVVETLEAAGIPAMLLKGIHLAFFLYEEPGLRTMADIDLMVRREHLADADHVLVSQGYGPVPRPDLEAHCAWSNHLPPLVKPGAERLEIHYAIERPTSPFSIDAEALWARARTLRIRDVSVRVLSDEDLLLHLCLHTAYHHQFERSPLKALADVAAVIDRGNVDWPRAVAIANAWGAGSFVYSTLRLVQDVLATRVPDSVIRALEHDPGDEGVIRVAARYILAPVVALPEDYVQMTRREQLRERVAVLFRGVFLPPAKIRRMYGLAAGSPFVWPFYLLRLADLLARRGGLMIRLLFHTRAVEPTLERLRDRREIEQWVERARAEAAR